MIKFTKMHGLGNDYVYIDNTRNIIQNPSNLAIRMSNRHFGIGSDGLILIEKSNIADFKMTMFNQDGSQAEMCGNGIRCVGKFVYDKKLTTKKEITIETLAGIKVLQLDVQDGYVKNITVDMGEPILDPKKIPVVFNSNPVLDLELEVLTKTFKFSCVSMGNPHAITIVDDLDNFPISEYGPIIEKDPHFPNKTNVEFIKILDKSNINMRVWERGAGETMACGTGACAATVACILNGYTDNEVTVKLLGGNLNILWNKQNNHIYMTGPAITVFEGGYYD